MLAAEFADSGDRSMTSGEKHPAVTAQRREIPEFCESEFRVCANVAAPRLLFQSVEIAPPLISAADALCGGLTVTPVGNAITRAVITTSPPAGLTCAAGSAPAGGC